MSESLQIKTTPPAIKSQDFDLLREEGMQLIRAVAADSWTDHNLHDPGITILEACCYAMTEIGLRSEIPMRDLLSNDASGRQQEFFTAAQILPVAPLTSNDIRKILNDHPLVENAWVYPLSSSPAGKLSVLLEFADDTLNSNTFHATIGTNQVDIAFPYWDDEEALPFNQDADLQLVTFETPFTPIEGTDAWFARIEVTYQILPAPVSQQKLWIVAQITTPLTDPITQVPPILAQLTTEVETLGDGSPADQSLLKQFNRRVISAHHVMRIVRRYLKDYRNLCEDFTDFKAVRIQEVAVSAIIEVNPGVLLESLLADIFFSIDQFIAPVNIFTSLTALQGQLETDKIFEGPLLHAGFLPDTSLRSGKPEFVLYTSDILRIMLQHRDQAGADVLRREDITTRNIVAVRSLNLANYLDNRPITSNARDCLHLVESQLHVPRLSLTKSHIVFYRNGVEVPYDLVRVIEIFNEMKAGLLQPVTGPADIPLPQGTPYPVAEYYPIQNDLPLVYGVGEAGLPDTATTERQALALQLKGYLFFFEQLTAGMFSQLASLNSFFSADPELEQTIFQQPLYHLPQIAPLLKSYNPATPWNNFINDPNNGYVEAMRQSAETPEQFLSRRNKVLNHLLAIFGEDMFDKAALAYRKASVVPNASTLSLPDLLKAQAAQQQIASRQLIRDKSAFLYDLPNLNRDRSQAFGNPAWRTDRIVTIAPVTGGFTWTINDTNGTPVLRGVAPAASAAACILLATETLSLATSPIHYSVVLEAPAQNRLVIQPVAATTAVAQSVITYPTPIAANAAITTTIQAMVQLWMRYALSPLEQRLYHMLGVAIKERRPLLTPTANFFEIVTEPPGPDINKSFRLWQNPGFTGDQLLVSATIYSAVTDPAATAAAQAGIDLTISRGVRLENYDIINLAPNVYQVVLLLPDTTVLARSGTNFATEALARESLLRTYEQLYRLYSAEGFYMIEHMFLAPQTTTDRTLNIEETDPYSFQLSFVFPSGYARDFSVADSAQQPAQPENYRDYEFRKLAEQQIRKACPAHILPRVYWVDQVLPGTAVPVEDASFNNFETRYRSWFAAWIADDKDETVIASLRDELVRSLNNIYTAITA